MSELSLTREKALLIMKLAKAVNRTVDVRPILEGTYTDELQTLIEKHCPSTWKLACDCHNDPFDSFNWRTTMALEAIDETLGTFGVQALGKINIRDGPPYQFCSAGDTYATTLIYTRDTDTLRIGCWGDIAEKFTSED